MNKPEEISIRVSVEQKHIERGRPRVPGKCPVALALQDAFAQHGLEIQHIFVFPNRAYFNAGTVEEKDSYIGEMSRTFRKLIRAFDSGESLTVHPCFSTILFRLWPQSD